MANARRIAQLLNSVLLFAVESTVDDMKNECDDELVAKIKTVVDFDRVGMLCGNPGLTIHMADGSEFQIQVVQSQLARPGEPNVDESNDPEDEPDWDEPLNQK
jgi:hypothetical protein